MNFKELEAQYSNYFIKKEFEEAIKLIDKAGELLSKEEYKENIFTLLNDKALIYFVSEKREQALDTYYEIVNMGYACDPRRIERLKLEENQKYLEVKEKNELLFSKAVSEAKLEYKVLLPKEYNKEKKYPLFFNLHGDGADGNINDQIRCWKPELLLQKGFIVVYPQSSQLYCYNGHGWLKDKELSRREIKMCYDEIINKYSIDKDNVIIAGFSGGANAVVDFSMYNVFPIKGFISLCPDNKVKTFNNEQVKEAVKRGIKGYIMEGEDDLAPQVKELKDELDDLGLSCKYVINKGVGHWFPNDLDDKTNDALDFFSKLIMR